MPFESKWSATKKGCYSKAFWSRVNKQYKKRMRINKMQFVEFDYESEDGLKVTIEGSGKIVHESNYSADSDNRKGYPIAFVDNIKYKCITEDGSLLDKSELSEDDQLVIEEMISSTLISAGNETDSQIHYNRSED